jgi:hypothetical protein
MKLLCEICHSYIARFDETAIFQPIAGVMFTSPNPRRQIPPPFARGFGWEAMRCPVCRKRPMIKPARLLTGHPRCFETPGVEPTYFDVPERAARVEQAAQAAQAAEQARAARICAVCGREYTSAETLQRYHTPCPTLAQGNED